MFCTCQGLSIVVGSLQAAQTMDRLMNWTSLLSENSALTRVHQKLVLCSSHLHTEQCFMSPGCWTCFFPLCSLLPVGFDLLQLVLTAYGTGERRGRSKAGVVQLNVAFLLSAAKLATSLRLMGLAELKLKRNEEAEETLVSALNVFTGPRINPCLEKLYAEADSAMESGESCFSLLGFASYMRALS